METRFVFATSAALADQEFPTLGALARHIVGLRAGLPRAADGEPHQLGCVHANIARQLLPHGAAIAVRLRDGSNGGRGQTLGYAFMDQGGAAGGCNRLMLAIEGAQAYADARAAAHPEAA